MGIPQDDDAIAVWTELFKSVGIDPKVEDEPWTYGASRGGRIFLYDEKENWWSRAGVPENMPVGEPGGPDSEMFYDFEPNGDTKDHPATDSARFLEIGNNVFMAFMRKDSGFELLDKPNIDYGGGLERICAALNGNPDLYLTPFFDNTRKKLAEISGKSYEGNERNFRIILDHTRAATFLIGDGAPPSNVDAGYITRRLMRRAIRVARKLDINESFMTKLAEIYIAEAAAYPELEQNKAMILDVIAKEEEQFQKTIQNGEREMQRHLEKNGSVTGRDAFYFYETFGFPLELTEEFLKEHGEKLLQPEEFEKAAKEHADKSRTAAAGKFAGGLADHSEKTTAFHTATHLMLAGLQQVLGTHVHQKGSNITGERARFDFSHGEKMTPEEKQAVEDFVNKAIEANAEMRVVEMPKQQAMDEGVEGSFWEKYPDIVKVYIFEDANGKVWSKELCGGPHVENTGKIGEFGRFKIKKEESSSAGVRRIKAVLKEA
jgi:alanyl-tRNA synthetase